MFLRTHRFCKYCGLRTGRTYSFSCQFLRDRCNQDIVCLANGVYKCYYVMYVIRHMVNMRVRRPKDIHLYMVWNNLIYAYISTSITNTAPHAHCSYFIVQGRVDYQVCCYLHVISVYVNKNKNCNIF